MQNHKYSVVICDDERRILKELKTFVEEIFQRSPYEGEVRTVSEAAKLASCIEKEPIDILLLDIDMPYINGLELASLITEKQLPILLIFVSNQESLVYESFQYQPFSFIRKSMYQKELEQTILRAIKKLLSKELFVLRIGAELIRLNLQEIYYMEAAGNYVEIVTDKETIRYRETLSNMERQLAAKGFVRIHKGFLVNEQAVYRLMSDKVILSNGAELPIGRKAREQTRRLLIRSFRI